MIQLGKNTSAYLDIETTGLSPAAAELTVIGVCLEGPDGCCDVIQLWGADISPGKVAVMMARAGTVYTYNGSRFDLRFIKEKLNIDISAICRHRDLMHGCWRKNLFGGLKSVERQLGIPRKLAGINGEDAVRLWHEYTAGDGKALEILLEYNREDVFNLIKLRERLGM